MEPDNWAYAAICRSCGREGARLPTILTKDGASAPPIKGPFRYRCRSCNADQSGEARKLVRVRMMTREGDAAAS